MSNEQRLLDDLNAAGIRITMHEHEPVFTVEESAGLHESIPGAHAKNLFLKSEDGRYWLVTIPHDRRADLKLMARKLASRKFSFGKSEAMEQLIERGFDRSGSRSDKQFVRDGRIFAGRLRVQGKSPSGCACQGS